MPIIAASIRKTGFKNDDNGVHSSNLIIRPVTLTLINARLNLMTEMNMQPVQIQLVASTVNVAIGNGNSVNNNATMNSKQLYIGPNESKRVGPEKIQSE